MFIFKITEWIINSLMALKYHVFLVVETIFKKIILIICFNNDHIIKLYYYLIFVNIMESTARYTYLFLQFCHLKTKVSMSTKFDYSHLGINLATILMYLPRYKSKCVTVLLLFLPYQYFFSV